MPHSTNSHSLLFSFEPTSSFILNTISVRECCCGRVDAIVMRWKDSMLWPCQESNVNVQSPYKSVIADLIRTESDIAVKANLAHDKSYSGLCPQSTMLWRANAASSM